MPLGERSDVALMQQRYYDPQIGRFLGTDLLPPSLNSGSNFNSYWYAQNSPLSFFDQDGRLSGHLCDIGGCDVGSFGLGIMPASPLPKMEGEVGPSRFTLSWAAVPVREEGQRPIGPFGGATWATYWAVIKPQKALEELKKKTGGAPSEQYALVAKSSQSYLNVRTGESVDLKEGDVWKYGQTSRPEDRCSERELRAMGVEYVTQFKGTKREVLIEEKRKLINYFLEHHHLPPGNHIFK